MFRSVTSSSAAKAHSTEPPFAMSRPFRSWRHEPSGSRIRLSLQDSERRHGAEVKIPSLCAGSCCVAGLVVDFRSSVCVCATVCVAAGSSKPQPLALSRIQNRTLRQNTPRSLSSAHVSLQRDAKPIPIVWQPIRKSYTRTACSPPP